jgi:hypothetical protein
MVPRVSEKNAVELFISMVFAVTYIVFDWALRAPIPKRQRPENRIKRFINTSDIPVTL